jgi:hypothetical protein
MGHIRYNGMTFDLPGEKFEEVKNAVANALKTGGLANISVQDREGDVSHLLITPGSNVSFHSWDAPSFNSVNANRK